MNQVIGFKHDVTIHRRALVREHLERRGSFASGLRPRRGSALGSPREAAERSVEGEIAHLVALQPARQLALTRQAEARLSSHQEQRFGS